MTAAARGTVRTDMQNQNGKNGGRRALSPRQATELAERETRELLDVSSKDAFEMLERGELDGTAAEAEVSMLRFLVARD
jgi:hypothetical protein